MAFRARYAGTCKTCGKPFAIGDFINWNRDVKGQVWHDTCPPPSLVLPSELPATPAVQPVAPAPAPLDAEAMIRAALEKMGLGSHLPPVAPAPAPAPVAYKPATLSPDAPWWQILEVIMLWAFATNKFIRILLIGPPGTGKSKTLQILAKTPYRKALHQRQAVEELIGMTHIRKGETVYLPIYIPVCMKDGKVMILDEIERWSNELESSAYDWMDDEPHCSLPDGTIQYSKPGYMIAGTSNASVSALPEALLDRIDIVIPALIPHPATMADWEPEERDLVNNHFRALPCATYQWAGKPTTRRMRSYRMLKPVVGEIHAAQIAFGTAGKEILSALQTASRTRTEKKAQVTL